MAESIEQIWNKHVERLGDPVPLPLIKNVSEAQSDNPALSGIAIAPTLTVQLNTLSGQHLLLPLTLEAARGLVLVVASTLLSLGYPLKQEPTEPTEPTERQN